MKYFSTFATITTTLAVALSGCAAVNDESVESVASDEQALTARPLSASQCKSFEASHPQTQMDTLSTGDVVGTPFRSCDLNSGAIFGTIDLAFAQQLLAGTGHVPLEVVQAGKPTMGLARIYLASYLSSDLGVYNEFVLLIDAAEENASPDAKSLKWVNPFSVLIPGFGPDNRTFEHQLILQSHATKAIAYGRELSGLDKRAGSVDLVQTANGMTFSVKDEVGAQVVRGALRPDKRLSTLLRTAGKLAGAAVGERVTPHDIDVKLHPLMLNQPMEVDELAFSRDVSNPAEIVRTKTTFWWLPTMNEASPQTLDFEIDASSELGKKLSDAHFTPAAVVTGEHMSVLFAHRD